MNTLIDANRLRAIFAIGPDVADERLGPCIAVASTRLRGWVGDEVYDDAASSVPVNVERKADLELAEADLAMHFALLGLNTQLRSNGVVKTERVEGAAIVGYLVPSEIRQLAAEYLNQAEEIVRPYGKSGQ
jgi:hypothetical protein